MQYILTDILTDVVSENFWYNKNSLSVDFRSLAKAIGVDNLQHVMDIMSMINDEQEIKVGNVIETTYRV